MIIGVPNVILWEQERQDDAFARIEELFRNYMLDPYVVDDDRNLHFFFAYISILKTKYQNSSQELHSLVSAQRLVSLCE